MSTQTYTDAEATDEGVLLLVRKLHRLHPAVHADLMGRLPDGAREALRDAELRADTRRAYDQRDGVTREYRDRWAELDAELAEEV